MGFFVACWFSNLPFKTLRTLREPIDSLPKPSLLHLYAAITTSHGTYRETPQEERRMFCCAPFVLFLRRVDSVQGWDRIITMALQRTAANGRKVWECFMLGIDPTKADDDFRITRFWMENGAPKFEFSHSADGAGNSLVPRIKPLGKENLSDSWQGVPLDGNPSFRFFTVEVELP